MTLARPLARGIGFSVNLTDAPTYAPRYLNAAVSGAVNVSVRLRNTGAIAHTFTVENASQAGVILNRSWTPENLTAYFATHPPLENVSVPAGLSAWANFSLNASTTFRSFEFVSTIPYQFQAGMWGFLNLTPTGSTLVLSVSTTDLLQFQPDTLSAGPSVQVPVTLDILVTNLGNLSHTFTVSSQPNVTVTSLASFATHPPLANVTVPAGPGQYVWANFTVPAVGVYEFVCMADEHFEAGMFGFLYVGVPVAALPPSPSTAILWIPVLVGSAVLLGLGLSLALVASFIGRFPRKPGPRDPPP